MRKIVAGLAIAGIVVVFGVFAIPEPDPFPAVPLPKLGDGPITLRVVRAINPRFYALTEAEIAVVLDQVADLVENHFGLEVRFERREDITIADLFAFIPEPASETALSFIYTLLPPGIAPLELVDSVAAQIETGRNSPEDVARYVQPFIPNASGLEIEQLAEAITNVWLLGLRRWRGLRAVDGDRVINSANYHQIALWGLLGYGDIPFDIIITNQLVASAETNLFAPHAAMRGGLTNGFTGFSRSGKFETFAMVSTFPFAIDLGDLNDLGPDRDFDPSNTTRYAASILAHEIGHLLLHLGHPWTNPACAMFPVPPDGMGAHAIAINSAQCPLNSEPAMTPGAVQLTYERGLLDAVTK
jgi:hypothetical protein